MVWCDMWFRVVIIFMVCFLAVPAWANSAEEARALILAGDYEAARVIAENLNTAEGYALAAESLSAQILLGEIGKLNKRSKQARKLAEAALALEPDNYNAKLQYALTDGFVTRTSGSLTAFRKKLPTKTLAIIEEFRTAYPDDPIGTALLAAWHMGVVRKTGAKNGYKWFGASQEEGERLYAVALAKAPQDIVIQTNYAMSLLVLDPAQYGPQARPLLEAVAAWPAHNNLFSKVQSRAGEILDAYDDPKQVKKLAERFLDGK